MSTQVVVSATCGTSNVRAAAAEDAISRIYLGVHYRFDADFGLSSGKSVADFVFSTQLRPL